MANSGLYQLRCIANGRFYLGSTRDLTRRKGQHFYRLKRGIHWLPALQSDWNEHGQAAFEFVPLEEVPVVDLRNAEQRWLDKLNGDVRCYNATMSAFAPWQGKHLSQETKEKIRQKLLGRKDSPEVRSRKSAGHTGLKRSAESIAKSVAARRGKVFGPEVRARVSAAARRRPEASVKTREKIRVKAIGRKQSEATREKKRLAMLAHFAAQRPLVA